MRETINTIAIEGLPWFVTLFLVLIAIGAWRTTNRTVLIPKSYGAIYSSLLCINFIFLFLGSWPSTTNVTDGMFYSFMAGCGSAWLMGVFIGEYQTNSVKRIAWLHLFTRIFNALTIIFGLFSLVGIFFGLLGLIGQMEILKPLALWIAIAVSMALTVFLAWFKNRLIEMEYKLVSRTRWQKEVSERAKANGSN